MYLSQNNKHRRSAGNDWSCVFKMGKMKDSGHDMDVHGVRGPNDVTLFIMTEYFHHIYRISKFILLE